MSFNWAANYMLSTINETISRREPARLVTHASAARSTGQIPNSHTRRCISEAQAVKVLLQRWLRRYSPRRVSKCGLHTKPHLVSMTERARIDSKPISETAFTELLYEMVPALEKTTALFNKPSYYETLLALTFYYFQAAQVDIADEVEVGIGGKLDGTNVLAPARYRNYQCRARSLRCPRRYRRRDCRR